MSIPVEITSVIIGSLISALTALYVATITIKNQFKEQRTLEIEKEDRLNLVALNSVRNEMVNNLIHLNRLVEVNSIMKNTNSDSDELNYYEYLSVDRWNKYGDFVGIVMTFEDTNTVETYYLNVSLKIKTTDLNIEEVKLLIKDGIEVRNIINKYLHRLEK